MCACDRGGEGCVNVCVCVCVAALFPGLPYYYFILHNNTLKLKNSKTP